MSSASALSTEEFVDTVDVVIVDDDKTTLEIVSWILRDTDVRFKLFSDYNLARAYLKTTVPKLLIVDFYMPVINGIEFIRQSQEQTDLSNTAIYLCSSITPRLADEKTMHTLGASLLEKQIVCDKPKFLSMIDRIF